MGRLPGADGGWYNGSIRNSKSGWRTTSMTRRLHLLLVFLAMSGMRYQLQYREDLASGSWQVLQEEIIGDGALHTVVEPLMSGSHRFFRVVLLP